MSHPPSSAAPVTPERIYQLGWGFAATQALVTAIELDLFGAIAGGARDVHALAAKLGASERGVRMVVDAMAGFGLVTKGPGGLALAPDAAMFLVRSSPAFVGDFLVLHGRELADRWRGLTDCVRTGRPVTALDRPEEGIPFWKKLVDGLFPVGFAAAQVAGKELARRHPTGELRLLDVAAGSGVWGFGAALAEPRVRVTTQDLPETLEHARAWAARTGVANRVAWLSGDLREVDFGTAAFDAAVLGHICHSEGAAHARRSRRSRAEAGRHDRDRRVRARRGVRAAVAAALRVEHARPHDGGDTFTASSTTRGSRPRASATSPRSPRRRLAAHPRHAPLRGCEGIGDSFTAATQARARRRAGFRGAGPETERGDFFTFLTRALVAPATGPRGPEEGARWVQARGPVGRSTRRGGGGSSTLRAARNGHESATAQEGFARRVRVGDEPGQAGVACGARPRRDDRAVDAPAAVRQEDGPAEEVGERATRREGHPSAADGRPVRVRDEDRHGVGLAGEGGRNHERTHAEKPVPHTASSTAK
jgi:hypothetical protein